MVNFAVTLVSPVINLSVDGPKYAPDTYLMKPLIVQKIRSLTVMAFEGIIGLVLSFCVCQSLNPLLSTISNTVYIFKITRKIISSV